MYYMIQANAKEIVKKVGWANLLGHLLHIVCRKDHCNGCVKFNISVLLILDPEPSNECIDLTIMCICYFFF